MSIMFDRILECAITNVIIGASVGLEILIAKPCAILFSYAPHHSSVEQHTLVPIFEHAGLLEIRIGSQRQKVSRTNLVFQ